MGEEYCDQNSIASEKCGEHNISCMPNAVKQLESAAIAYALAVISTQAIREALRALRKLRYRNNRAAAEAAGISPSTVAKIENVATWPDYDPGIGIVFKLLTAMKTSMWTLLEAAAAVEQNQKPLTRSQFEALLTTAGLHHDHTDRGAMGTVDEAAQTSPPSVQADDKARALRYLEEQIRAAQLARAAILKFPAAQNFSENQGEHATDNQSAAGVRALAAERHPTDRSVRGRHVQHPPKRRPRPKER